MRVVLPDPLGPMIAVIVPGSNFPDIVVKIDFGWISFLQKPVLFFSFTQID